jgi:hypothetical protein
VRSLPAHGGALWQERNTTETSGERSAKRVVAGHQCASRPAVSACTPPGADAYPHCRTSVVELSERAFVRRS